MKLLSIQIALFTKEILSRPDLILTDVNSKLGSIFDAMPNILNLPPEVPAEIPLVQARSTNGLYALNVSRNRVDFMISPQYEEDILPSELFKKYRPQMDKYCKSVINITDLVRIGVIITLFHETENNIMAIYDKYLNIPYSNDCTEINLRTNRQKLIKGIVYNNIKTVQAAELHVGDINHTGVIIQVDTNNIPEKDKEISENEIVNMLNQVAGKIKPGEIKELI